MIDLSNSVRQKSRYNLFKESFPSTYRQTFIWEVPCRAQTMKLMGIKKIFDDFIDRKIANMAYLPLANPVDPPKALVRIGLVS